MGQLFFLLSLHPAKQGRAGNVFGDGISLFIRSLDEQYQIWCLLEMRDMLEQLEFEQKEFPVLKGELEKNLNDKKSYEAFSFKMEHKDGLTAVLTHEQEYRCRENGCKNNIGTMTTMQRPDILLHLTNCEESRFWIFDAKYRIVTKEEKQWPYRDGIDGVYDDDINQMHRYRDALVCLGQDGKVETPIQRPIRGAFLLYPGWFEKNNEDPGSSDPIKVMKQNPYNDAIQKVSIGAFPLLPDKANNWLRAFLRKQVDEMKRKKE